MSIPALLPLRAARQVCVCVLVSPGAGTRGPAEKRQVLGATTRNIVFIEEGSSTCVVNDASVCVWVRRNVHRKCNLQKKCAQQNEPYPHTTSSNTHSHALTLYCIRDSPCATVLERWSCVKCTGMRVRGEASGACQDSRRMQL